MTPNCSHFLFLHARRVSRAVCTGRLIIFLTAFGLAAGTWVPTEAAPEARCCAPAPPDSAAVGSIYGTVIDRATGEPLPDANVTVLETQTGTSTGRSGAFHLDDLTPGRYTVAITYVGYVSRYDTVALAAGQHRQLQISLQSSSIRVTELHVKAGANDTGPRDLGVYRISAEELVEIPSAVQSDLFRSLQKLPGIKASSDFSSGLYIRGGSPDQTLIQLDGATLYNPTHFLGLFSSFNPDAVEEVTLHKGAYPATYGGRLGSVVDIAQKSGSSDEMTGSASVGLLASRAALGGPLNIASVPGGGSWMVALRRSTMEPLLAQMNSRGVDGLPEKFRFHDVTARGVTRLSPASRLSLSLFSGRDAMDFPFGRNLVFDVAYGNHAGSARWQYFPNDRLLATVRAAVSRYATDSRTTMTRDPFTRQNTITDASLTTDFDYSPGEAVSLRAGAETGRIAFELHDSEGERSILDHRGSSFLHAGYAQTTVTPGERWQLKGGVRAAYFASGDYLRIAPRLSAQYRAGQRLHLQAAGGRYHQFVTRSPSQLLSSFDAWLTAAPGLAPSRSHQLTTGLEWTDAGWRVSGEVYLRTMDDLFTLDTRGMDATGQSYAELFRTGSGYAYGAEAIARKNAGVINGFLAYTYGKTRRRSERVNGGRYYAPKYDRTHDLSLVLNVTFADNWQATGTFTYATGQPYTRPSSQYVLMDSPTRQWRNLFVTSYNNARLPSYHRTDLGVTRKGLLSEQVSYEARLQVVNIFGHSNPWLKVYNFDGGYTVQATDMPQIPVPVPNLSFALSF